MSDEETPIVLLFCEIALVELIISDCARKERGICNFVHVTVQ